MHPSPRRRDVEVETLAELDRLLASHARTGDRSMQGWRLQGLDLRARSEDLRRLDPAGALFLGCRLEPSVEERLRAGGALVFPVVPDVPLQPYRSSLYTPEELYDGLDDTGYDSTLDARVLAWTRRSESADVRSQLTGSLHDLAVDDALEELVRGRRMVGVMGGHAAQRGSDGYRDAARLGRSLTRAGLTVATGGGPGAMEAANLGGYLADREDVALEEALELLSTVPGFAPSVGDWARTAFEVRQRWPGGRLSVGVPTWFYGHEPPNVFAGQIAKYVGNAVREDVLLHLARAGTVFLPGGGGTVQEVFQDACENYYAEPGAVAPMVLVGVEHWTDRLPVWPLLRRLAEGRPMQDAVHLVDDPADVLPLLAT